MKSLRTIPKMATVVACAAIGLTACSDEPTIGERPSSRTVPLALEVSSQHAKAGELVAVAVKLDVQPGTAGVIQGNLEFDAARLRYVGQSPVGSAIAIVNAKRASSGALTFGAFNPNGIDGRVALFVFESRGDGYASGFRYVSDMASGAKGDHRKISIRTVGTTFNSGLLVPTDASVMTAADWSARIMPAGAGKAAIAARPGEYRENLRYGDVTLDGLVNGDDYIAVANTAVGNDQLIIGTDDPGNDKDLVIAGNVFPTNSGGVCGNETDGTRRLDGDDYIAVANFAVGNPETCAGTQILGRGPLATNRIQINAADTIRTAVSWTRNNVYQLNGIVVVADGGSITLEAGTRVEGLTQAAPSALFITRGGQIFAEGTLERPIVFTCTGAKQPGCWSGVWISGKAPITAGTTGNPSPAFPAIGGRAPVPADAGGCNQRVGEAGNAPFFGGCTPTDNSGILRYVVVEYGGFVVAPNRELNNLTLAAVGSGTIIDHVQAHGGLDDGVEFFGGTVSTRYVLSTGNNDDGFDADFGFSGTHQFWIIQQDQGNVSSTDDSRAFEIDNSSASTTLTFRTSPRMSNFTVLGANVTADLNSTASMMIRTGAGPKLYNSIIDGYRRAITLRDAATCNAFATGVPEIRSTTFTDVLALGSSVDEALPGFAAPQCAPATVAGTVGEAEFLSLSNGFRQVAGAGAIDGILFGARNNVTPDWRMRDAVAGGPIEGATESVSAFGMTDVAYRGAVGPLNNGAIPWYAGWSRSFTSTLVP